MSRRTAESNKAILVAWDNERKLVQEGKGTREWTLQQQHDILDKGKAYDDNGIAFQGQHMKSVEMYPEYQGDPGNIQLLTRAEHLEAHDGNWKNPTNWYFDPVTKEKVDFGDGPYIPCEAIQLAEPLITLQKEALDGLSSKSETVKVQQPESPHKAECKETSKVSKHKQVHVAARSTLGFAQRIRQLPQKIVELFQKHPILTSTLVVFGSTAVKALANEKANNGSIESSLDNALIGCSDDEKIDVIETDDNDDLSFNRDYPEERCSPIEHTVRKHSQRYHTKDGIITKEKEAYPRGGKHDKD